MFRKANRRSSPTPCLERSRNELSPWCPLPFPRGSSCPARGVCVWVENRPLHWGTRVGVCMDWLLLLSLEICFDIQLQERVPPPSWFCTQSTLLPLGTWPYRQRTHSRQLLKQNSLLRWLLKLGIEHFFFFSLCRQRYLAENILWM